MPTCQLRSALRGLKAMLLAGGLAGIAALAAPAADPVQASSYWRERTAFFHAFGQHADIVMLGDSLTDGAEWRELFPGLDIVNRGIDGDTSQGVLARLDDVVRLRPRQVFVMVGINDFAHRGREVDEVFRNYREIVARLERGGAHVFIQSTLPCNETQGTLASCRTVNRKIAQLDARLAGLASATTTFIALGPALAGPEGLKSEFTYDGVHLNAEGYRRWRDAIAPSMPGGAARPGARP